MTGPGARSGLAARGLLAALAVFTVAALAGYASFGLHPSLLGRFPSAAGTYGLALRVFPLGQVWLAFIVMTLYLCVYSGARWIRAFVLLYALSLSSELLGTGYGIPFGAYHYSSMLGPEWMGRVPILIPLSWFSMTIAAYAMSASGAVRGHGGKVVRIALASLLLLCWDLSLDPAMSHATTYWVWGASGPYYGMPWSNLAGWYVTGLVLAGALSLVGADEWMNLLSRRWLAGFYAANVLLAAGMNIAAGLWVACAATAVALLATLGAISVADRRQAQQLGAGGGTQRLGVA
ncbi:MAG: carotenoid biosynthesis protein [Gemmatimonadota bacterium]|nr:carotenoid biosynthesis protein [Gemmatimonadota bacterium]